MPSPVPAGSERIGDLLRREGLITKEQLDQALQEQKQSGTRVGYNLVKLGFIDEVSLTKTLARQYKMPAVDLSQFEVDPKVVRLIPGDVALKNLVLPLKREGRTLTVAMADPTNIAVIDDLKFITRYDIFPVIAGEFTLRNALEKVFESTDVRMTDLMDTIAYMDADDELEVVDPKEEEQNASGMTANVDDAPVVKLLNAILTDAVKRGASDIHFECFEQDIRVRYRIDGELQEIMKPPKKMQAALVSRFKIMSSLNIAERRVPQDGRIKLKMGKKVIDFRVSTLPTIFGEKVVLRILDKGNLTLDLEKFGIEPAAEKELMDAVQNPYGMVLVTGPTGSGKTTTLYSCLSKVNNIDTNIMTAEDPVEYNLYGVNQVLVRTTGHMVLSTLHTNSAPETVTRLMDMGLEPFNVSSALNLVLAQRLVRRVCSNCKIKYQPDAPELDIAKVKPDTRLGDMRFTQVALDGARTRAPQDAAPFLANLSLDTKIKDLPFFKGTGCEKCSGSGTKGRQGLYEVMFMTPALRKLILQNVGAAEIRDAAVDGGMLTLRMDGWLKVMKGATTLEQVVRETTV
ncbi:MAG: ATPase, T2SS/T4P/T4SS family [Gemmatimonadetes bacterium]|nr:ATPase, T2SS/T4P/T4SS family [Gemmatimonadota bacterium]